MAQKITFLGGVGTVTGSKFLVEYEGGRVLVDCGLFQGLKELRLQNWQRPAVAADSVDAVLLTHAHLDHSGYLPLFSRAGFRGKVYCTPPTQALSRIILVDSAKIQEEDARQANEGGYSKHSPAIPLYSSGDVTRALTLFAPVGLDNWTALPGGAKFRFRHSGHILGSAFVELKLPGGARLAFSGDLGRKRPLLLSPPEQLTQADYVIVESTYGDRNHARESPLKALEKVILETSARHGTLIIPSFAVGRVQDLLYLISKLKSQRLIPDLPVYLDSPMGINATEVFTEFSDWHKLGTREIKALCDVVTMVRSAAQSVDIMKAKGPAIVIAGSGMLSGGRVLSHLERRLPEERNTVLLVGYQAAGTRGRLLRDGIGELKMRGRYVPVRAHIAEISMLSAHADQAETIEWLSGFRRKPKLSFVVHGEPQAAECLRVRMTDALGWQVRVPKPGESFEL